MNALTARQPPVCETRTPPACKRMFLALLFSIATGLYAQSPTPPQSPVKMEFEVASVRQNKAEGAPSSNVPLGPGDVYSPTGGLFKATNLPLISYILFAYKVTGNPDYLVHQMPEWVTTDRFDIQARTDVPNPTKDQMRLMMRALLADRFKFAIHNETQQLPVFALVLLKPGKTGPRLQPHPGDVPCIKSFSTPSEDSAPPPPQADSSGFPSVCGGVAAMPPSVPGRINFGARDISMKLVATTLAYWGNLGGTSSRPVIDQTGLTGNVDFAFEFSPELPPGANPGSFQPDATGPTFLEALKDQLGLKLEPQKGPVEMMVVDHVDHPSDN